MCRSYEATNVLDCNCDSEKLLGSFELWYVYDSNRFLHDDM